MNPKPGFGTFVNQPLETSGPCAETVVVTFGTREPKEPVLLGTMGHLERVH